MRPRHLALLLLGLSFTAAASAPSQPARRADLAPLRAQLQAYIERAPGTVAVELVDLGDDQSVGIHQDVRMHAASTMKVPVMLELYRQADAGKFALSDKVRVKNRFTSIADGSTYSLSSKDDSETKLYGLVGKKLPIRELIGRMITRSSNLATDNVIELVGAKNVQQTLDAIGAGDMHVLRGVEDIPAYRRGMNNTTTAAALARVMAVIARCARPHSDFPLKGRLAPLTHASCRQMVDILLEQHFNTMIPRGVPSGVRVAHKTGSITKIHHDAAIVYPRGRAPYVLVVMTRGIADPKVSAGVAADISRMVWKGLMARSREG